MNGYNSGFFNKKFIDSFKNSINESLLKGNKNGIGLKKNLIEDKTASGRETGIGADKTAMQPDKTWDEIAKEEAGKSVAFKGKDLTNVKFERKDGKVYADGIELTTASTKTSHYAADAPTRAGMTPKPLEKINAFRKDVGLSSVGESDPRFQTQAGREAMEKEGSDALASQYKSTPKPESKPEMSAVVTKKPSDVLKDPVGIVAASAKAIATAMPKVGIGPTSRQAAAEVIAKNAAQDTDAARAEKIKAAEARRERTSGSELGRMMQGQTTFEDPNTGKPVKFTPLIPSDIRPPAAGSATKPGSTVEIGKVDSGTFGVTPAGQAEIQRQAGGSFEDWKRKQAAREPAIRKAVKTPQGPMGRLGPGPKY